MPRGESGNAAASWRPPPPCLLDGWFSSGAKRLKQGKQKSVPVVPVGPRMMNRGVRKVKVKKTETIELAKSVQPHFWKRIILHGSRKAVPAMVVTAPPMMEGPMTISVRCIFFSDVLRFASL